MGPELAVVVIEPFNPQSAPVSWIDAGKGLVLTVGFGNHARWELDLSTDDLQFLNDAIRAAIDGRVSSVLSRHEDEVTVVHSDGTSESTAGSDRWPFLLRRRKRSRRHVRYVPYRNACEVE